MLKSVTTWTVDINRPQAEAAPPPGLEHTTTGSALATELREIATQVEGFGTIRAYGYLTLTEA